MEMRESCLVMESKVGLFVLDITAIFVKGIALIEMSQASENLLFPKRSVTAGGIKLNGLPSPSKFTILLPQNAKEKSSMETLFPAKDKSLRDKTCQSCLGNSERRLFLKLSLVRL